MKRLSIMHVFFPFFFLCAFIIFDRPNGTIEAGSGKDLPVYAEYKDTLIEHTRLVPYGKAERLEFYTDTFRITRMYYILPEKGKRYVPGICWE